MKSRLTIYINLFFLIFLGNAFKAQNISVNTNYTPQYLVENIFFGNQNASCITIENVTINGWDFGNGNKSFGYFNRNGSNYPMDEGIILSTGSALEAIGPNNSIQTQNGSSPFNNSSWAGDQDLENAVQVSNTYNATVLEFDFTTNLSNKISFNFSFDSEQYLRNGDPGTCGYTDGFAFLIRKANETTYQNLAVIPNTNIPITSNNIRGSGGKCPPSNEEYFGSYNPDQSPTNFNGQTKILEAKADIIPGTKYHLKIIVADQGNGFYDSAVFLKAGSFTGYKDLGQDRLISTGNAICSGTNLVLNATTSGATNYQWYKNGIAISGANSATYTVTDAGFYEVTMSVSGCKLKGSINIEYTEQPLVTEQTFSNCDDNLDGQTEVNLQNLNAQIVTNYQSNFVVKYYLNPSDANAGNTNSLPNNWTYSGNTTIYVRSENGTCLGDIKPLHLNTGTPIAISQPADIDVCDHDLDGNANITLSDYIGLFTSDSTVTAKYYPSETDAKNSTNPITNPAVTFSQNPKIFYYRFEKSGNCPQVGEIKFLIKSPRKSTTLVDQVICPNSIAILDAGIGFDSYVWSNGATTPSINVGIGDYYVDLESNGCIYRQNVSITASETPVITNIEVNGSTVSISVIGGTTPYQYSIDNINYQSSNIFYNIPRGLHKVYVKSGDGCYTIEGEFLILNLINVITPNGDGYNDTLDYSDLKIKNNVSIQIFDRFGQKVYQSKNQNYIWDGKLSGRSISTGTYWYVISWEEPLTNSKKEFSGWILLKNRN